MITKILGGVVVALLIAGMVGQQRAIRQLQSELGGLDRPGPQIIETPAEVEAPGSAQAAALSAARAEVQALQVRVIGLEARVQTLGRDLEREPQRQRDLLAKSPEAGRVQAELLREQALDPKRSIKDRFGAFRALLRNGFIDAQTTTAFLDDMMALQDDELTAALFGALDNTGNLAAAPTLIKGLQSEKVELRMRALDALSEMQSDATVVQWLQHVARNDAQEHVRAEAVRVLAQAGNKP